MEKKKLNLKLIIAYLTALLSVGFCIYVLLISLNPKVSKEYRAFYIDKSLKYMPGEGQADVKIGTQLYLNGKDAESTFKGVGKGWSWNYTGAAMENEGWCFTTGLDNYLCFFNMPEGNHELILHVYDCDASAMEVFIGDTSVGVFDVAKDSEVHIPVIGDAADLMVNIKPMEDGNYTKGMIAVDYLVVR